MSRIGRDLARRLAASGVDVSVLAAIVNDMAAARSEAINREGLEAQIAYLLEAYGPDEIERLTLSHCPREKRP